MSVNPIEVRDTIVNGTKSPSLEHLMSKSCTKAELQAALVQLIQIVNMNQMEYKRWANKVENVIKGKQDRPWRASM